MLAAHDLQVRRDLSVPPGFLAEDTGRVLRVTAPADSSSSFITWSDLDGGTADVEIAGQLEYFARLGQSFEWKTYGRDRPADLGARLLDAGFVSDDPEALVVGEVSTVLSATAGHEGVTVRDATPDDMPSLLELSEAVWGHDATGLFVELLEERDHDPRALVVLVAVADGSIVSIGWIRLPAHEFASLWGGSTHPEFRGRGIYRSLVRRRALLAADRGHRYLQVDCTPDSRPILERLGMTVIDTTTPYRWQPGPA